MTMSEERQIGRAKNATLMFLERRISVPKIYIDADWDGERIDVLAIDRDGVGDVHAVLLSALILPTDSSTMVQHLTQTIDPLLKRFLSISAQYKYIATVDVSAQGDMILPGIPHSVVDKSFSSDGIGRVGLLTINFPVTGEPQVNIAFKPERFRAKIAKLADDYVQQHEADWEIRA